MSDPNPIGTDFFYLQLEKKSNLKALKKWINHKNIKHVIFFYSYAYLVSLSKDVNPLFSRGSDQDKQI